MYIHAFGFFYTSTDYIVMISHVLALLWKTVLAAFSETCFGYYRLAVLVLKVVHEQLTSGNG